MVAPLKKHNISQALVYLALVLGLPACDSSNKTIVTLHHKDPTTLEKLIETSLGGNAEFTITGSDIIFFTNKDKISETLDLLRLLDNGPSLYKLNFKHSNINSNHYSTNPLPEFITLIEGRFSKGDNSITPNKFKVERQGKDSSLLSIAFKQNQNVTIQYVLLPHNQWHKAPTASLPKNTLIKLDLINSPLP